jgi:hypothetical protein
MSVTEVILLQKAARISTIRRTKNSANIGNFLRHADKLNALKFKLWVNV